jgi:hypothetical protein
MKSIIQFVVEQVLEWMSIRHAGRNFFKKKKKKSEDGGTPYTLIN